ncbi:uncharacterized protein LOC135629363 [Musa acuminata AAA Group]|uniref:(wild Malaysian banana) hypothetical protein n=1 Tax=Musa acuminata subsp. malaccensis TaxID=214687 RepID=A0A804HPV4_MUSAM|nr:PREDICTED: uncharacterized protein LOC103978901 [Musa acuminata subsp. malaccensis]CAG1858438.1 unnamed protein product [Musa acuminata subsp. malaccensis]
MGFLFRVRLASFFAGAAAASLAGFCLLYKDYMLAHDAIAQQAKGVYEDFDERFESLNKRVTALENQKKSETTKPAEIFD